MPQLVIKPLTAMAVFVRHDPDLLAATLLELAEDRVKHNVRVEVELATA